MKRRSFLQILGLASAVPYVGKLSANNPKTGFPNNAEGPRFGKLESFTFYETGYVRHIREYSMERDININRVDIIHKGQMHGIDWFGDDVEEYALREFARYLKANNINLEDCELWVNPKEHNFVDFLDNELIDSINKSII